MTKLREWLIAHDACCDALAWAGDRTPERAWNECPDPAWLIWAAHQAGVQPALLAQSSLAVARSVLPYVPDGEERPRMAVEAGEQCLADGSAEAWRAAWRAAATAAEALHNSSTICDIIRSVIPMPNLEE